MTFHVAVMQYTGDVTDRGPHSYARVRGTDVGRSLVTGFEMMLDEHLPRLLTGVVKVEFPLARGGRGRVEWRWPPTPGERERRMVGNVAVGLAAAFFRTADETARRGRAVWAEYQRWVRGRNLDGADN